MKKILLVEDNEECRKMPDCIIRYLGYDGCRASLEQPDLILISLDFPRLWGFDATISIKDDPQTSDIPILILPPWDSEEVTEAAVNAGATEVLKEPFTLESFREVLEKYTSPDPDPISEMFALPCAA